MIQLFRHRSIYYKNKNTHAKITDQDMYAVTPIVDYISSPNACTHGLSIHCFYPKPGFDMGYQTSYMAGRNSISLELALEQEGQVLRVIHATFVCS